MANTGNGIKMTQESVQALKTLATSLPEASEQIKNATALVESSFEEKKELLGPHTNEISAILETVASAQETGHSSVVKVQGRLIKAAAKLSAILGNGFGSGGGKS